MSRLTNEKRLRGEADDENSPVDDQILMKEYNESEKKQIERTLSFHDPISENAQPRIKRSLSSTGDPRIDEMLECALENLKEAGKALASLSENLEHDLKLFLIELMGRIRKWTSQVESKIEWTRRDVLELHKELATQLAAIKNSQRESVILQEKQVIKEIAKLTTQTETLGLPYQQKSKQGLNKVDGASGHGVMSQSLSRIQSRMDNCEESNCQTDSHGGELERLQTCISELEAEMIDLRKENKRIVKERADYENAIQRALLKGVSSLNVEALKVLRCTPIQNCGPPCHASTSVEPMTKTSTECSGNNNGQNSTGRSCRNSPSSNESSDTLNGTSGRICSHISGYSDRKSRKSCNNNMLLLLHQKDAENFGIQTNSNRCENSSKKITTCPGNNCTKFRKSNYTC